MKNLFNLVLIFWVTTSMYIHNNYVIMQKLVKCKKFVGTTSREKDVKGTETLGRKVVVKD